MEFSKMHGLGNDYIYVNVMDTVLPNPDKLSVLWSDRHKGIGSDGIILIGRSSKADFSMRIFNADGSEALMCGNGSRCVGKYVYDKGLTDKRSITVETLAGVKSLDLILIMSVSPGFGGQKFMEGTYAKLSEVRQMYAEVFGHAYGDDVPRLEVDGGINLQNVASVLAAGADTIVTGSAVFRGDIADNTRRFLSILAGEKE